MNFDKIKLNHVGKEINLTKDKTNFNIHMKFIKIFRLPLDK